MNGGTCIDGVDSFACSCPTGSAGVLCECDEKGDCADLPFWYRERPFRPITPKTTDEPLYFSEFPFLEKTTSMYVPDTTEVYDVSSTKKFKSFEISESFSYLDEVTPTFDFKSTEYSSASQILLSDTFRYSISESVDRVYSTTPSILTSPTMVNTIPSYIDSTLSLSDSLSSPYSGVSSTDIPYMSRTPALEYPEFSVPMTSRIMMDAPYTSTPSYADKMVPTPTIKDYATQLLTTPDFNYYSIEFTSPVFVQPTSPVYSFTTYTFSSTPSMTTPDIETDHETSTTSVLDYTTVTEDVISTDENYSSTTDSSTDTTSYFMNDESYVQTTTGNYTTDIISSNEASTEASETSIASVDTYTTSSESETEQFFTEDFLATSSDVTGSEIYPTDETNFFTTTSPEPSDVTPMVPENQVTESPELTTVMEVTEPTEGETTPTYFPSTTTEDSSVTQQVTSTDVDMMPDEETTVKYEVFSNVSQITDSDGITPTESTISVTEQRSTESSSPFVPEMISSETSVPEFESYTTLASVEEKITTERLDKVTKRPDQSIPQVATSTEMHDEISTKYSDVSSITPAAAVSTSSSSDVESTTKMAFGQTDGEGSVEQCEENKCLNGGTCISVSGITTVRYLVFHQINLC